jgi:hypothetical protein
MTAVLDDSTKTGLSVGDVKPRRIGIILADNRSNLPAIKLFLLSMNKAQSYFEYEILPYPADRVLLSQLQAQGHIDRNKIIRPTHFAPIFTGISKNGVSIMLKKRG